MVFQKGHKGYKPKGAKAKTTLLKQERRAIFDAEVSQDWIETIKKLKPEYKADQFMGRAEEKVRVILPKPIANIFKPDDNNDSHKEDSKVVKED